MTKKIISLRKHFAKKQQQQLQKQNIKKIINSTATNDDDVSKPIVDDKLGINDITDILNNKNTKESMLSVKDKSSANSINKRKISSNDLDENEYWKSIEKNQNKHKLKKITTTDSDDNNSSSSDSESDNDDIDLEGNLEDGILENYTFEFNDMKEDYAEGICMMLKNHSFIANPTEAYQLAILITSQSKIV